MVNIHISKHNVTLETDKAKTIMDLAQLIEFRRRIDGAIMELTNQAQSIGRFQERLQDIMAEVEDRRNN